MEYGKEI